MRELQRAAAEAKRLEAERIKQEKQARRDAFKAVVNGLVSEGKVTALSQWAEFKDALEVTPEGAAVIADGVQLQSVFYDVVDELMARFKPDKRVRAHCISLAVV